MPRPDPRLPAGPSAGALTQTVMLHRDPLGTLRAAQARHGDVFTLRLATARPIVVVAAPEAVRPLLRTDPSAARAGSARRAILPLASARSVWGSDEPRHRAAHAPLERSFGPDAVAGLRGAIAEIAERHAAAWPRGRPFRLLPRVRTLMAEIFVRLVLRIDDERRAAAGVAALRRMLWTPGNAPLGVPGEGDGLLGSAATALFERRQAPLARLLAAEVERRRGREPGDGDIIDRLLRADPARTGPDVADELTVLLAAAQEPPAAALTTLLDRLGRDPDLAERFADPRERDAIERESLRLRPAALAGLRRLTARREVAGHVLPAGTIVMVPIPLLHRDPRAFPRPDAFAPERFTGPEPPDLYLPFGDGARRCLGEPLARAELAEIVPAILGRVRLRPLWPQPERAVLRGTILVPHRSGLAVATLR
jgi:cytochrome P450 family 135